MFITITVIMYSLLISAESAISETKEVIEGDTLTLSCNFDFPLHHCEWSFDGFTNESTSVTAMVRA